MNETNLVRRLQVEASKLGTRVMRNNCGLFFTRDGRPTHAGLAVGSSDLIGWTTIEITPEQVGRRVAIFTALEVKTATGRLTPEQRAFIEAVASAGGIAGCVRGIDDLAAMLQYPQRQGAP